MNLTPKSLEKCMTDVVLNRPPFAPEWDVYPISYILKNGQLVKVNESKWFLNS
jgi:hypothetical protein